MRWVHRGWYEGTVVGPNFPFLGNDNSSKNHTTLAHSLFTGLAKLDLTGNCLWSGSRNVNRKPSFPPSCLINMTTGHHGLFEEVTNCWEAIICVRISAVSGLGVACVVGGGKTICHTCRRPAFNSSWGTAVFFEGSDRQGVEHRVKSSFQGTHLIPPGFCKIPQTP